MQHFNLKQQQLFFFPLCLLSNYPCLLQRGTDFFPFNDASERVWGLAILGLAGQAWVKALSREKLSIWGWTFPTEGGQIRSWTRLRKENAWAKSKAAKPFRCLRGASCSLLDFKADNSLCWNTAQKDRPRKCRLSVQPAALPCDSQSLAALPS